MCNDCLNDNKIKSVTTLTFENVGNTITVENIPCLKCRKCGEVMFSDEVSERLEKIFDLLKGEKQENIIVNYERQIIRNN